MPEPPEPPYAPELAAKSIAPTTTKAPPHPPHAANTPHPPSPPKSMFSSALYGDFDSDAYDEEHKTLIHQFYGYGAGDRDDDDDLGGGIDPLTMQPRKSDTKKGGGLGALLPLLLLGFFGCFMFQSYQNSRPARSQRDDQEGMGLMEFCRPSRTGSLLSRQGESDRRCDSRSPYSSGGGGGPKYAGVAYGQNGNGRAGNGASQHGHEEDDDDGML